MKAGTSYITTVCKIKANNKESCLSPDISWSLWQQKKGDWNSLGPHTNLVKIYPYIDCNQIKLKLIYHCNWQGIFHPMFMGVIQPLRCAVAFSCVLPSTKYHSLWQQTAHQHTLCKLHPLESLSPRAAIFSKSSLSITGAYSCQRGLLSYKTWKTSSRLQEGLHGSAPVSVTSGNTDREEHKFELQGKKGFSS